MHEPCIGRVILPCTVGLFDISQDFHFFRPPFSFAKIVRRHNCRPVSLLLFGLPSKVDNSKSRTTVSLAIVRSCACAELHTIIIIIFIDAARSALAHPKVVRLPLPEKTCRTKVYCVELSYLINRWLMMFDCKSECLVALALQ